MVTMSLDVEGRSEAWMLLVFLMGAAIDGWSALVWFASRGRGASQ